MQLAIAIAAASLLVGACASSEGGSDPIVEEGKLSNNGLVVNLEALDALSTVALAIDSGQQLTMDENAHAGLLQASGGKELLSYVATCALEEGQSLTIASTGEVYQGSLGLASSWAGQVCDETCQGWVSACLLAHANANGQAVSISPRGAHPGLSWSQSTVSEYAYEEAAYYGNVFLAADQRVMVACGGAGLASEQTQLGGEFDLDAVGSNFVEGRLCGTGDCGLTFVGFCDYGTLDGVETLPVDISSCSEVGGDYYSGCLTEERDEPQLGYRADEVVTVYLAR